MLADKLHRGSGLLPGGAPASASAAITAGAMSRAVRVIAVMACLAHFEAPIYTIPDSWVQHAPVSRI